MTIKEQHKLVQVTGFVGGYDAYCDHCYNPDFEDGWNGFEGLYNATQQEVDDWYYEHVLYAEHE